MEWTELGWQQNYRPFDPQRDLLEPRQHYRFDHTQYEAVLTAALHRFQYSLRPAPTRTWASRQGGSPAPRGGGPDPARRPLPHSAAVSTLLLRPLTAYPGPQLWLASTGGSNRTGRGPCAADPNAG